MFRTTSPRAKWRSLPGGLSAAGGGIYSGGTLTLEGGATVQNNQPVGGRGGDLSFISSHKAGVPNAVFPEGVGRHLERYYADCFGCQALRAVFGDQTLHSARFLAVSL